MEPTKAEIIAFIESRRRSHYYCEDSWYSCPKAVDGCADEEQGDACNCGANQWNAEIDAMLGRLTAAPDTERTK